MTHRCNRRNSLRLATLAIGFLAAGSFAQDIEILGAGATFPYPLYSKMFAAYNQLYGARINYQSIGSGGGIRQLQSKTVDFGATDAFMSDEDLAKIPQEIVHVPTCLGAVVITYNLPGSPALKLSGKVVSGMFMGTITTWNDKAIADLNPGVKLPKMRIVVVHRSDGSGTSSIVTTYLSKVSTGWKEKVGAGKSVKWPTGLGAKGNEGVSGMVKQMKGSIGYCELAYALHNGMPTALLKNSKGNFIKPSIESISAAAESGIPADTRVSLTNPSAENGYPISGFTWLILYREQNYDNRDKAKVEGVAKLLWWMIHDGQKYAAPLDYAPLSAEAVKKAEAILRSVTFDGQKVLTQ